MTRFLAILTACLMAQACATHVDSQKRNDAMFDRIQQGMTPEQVRDITGAPDNTMPFPLSGNLSWGYFYWDQFGYYVEFSVTFAPDGKVLSKAYRRMNDGGRNS